MIHRKVTLPKIPKKLIILCDEIIHTYIDLHFLNLQINNMPHRFRFQIIEMKIIEWLWLIGLYLIHSADAGTSFSNLDFY